MPEYLAPGVYIEEIEARTKPIEGVATSTAAFLGATERGPVQPRLVTSYTRVPSHFRRSSIRANTCPIRSMPFSIMADAASTCVGLRAKPHQEEIPQRPRFTILMTIE